MPLPVSMDATWLNGSTSFNAQELRRAGAAGFGGDGAAFSVRGGIVRHGDTSLAVTVNASDVVTVQPGAVVIPGNSGVGNGCYCSALGAAETGNLTARSATLPRIDLVVFRVLDTDVVASNPGYTGRIEIIAGTPAASPVAPALPLLAVELARISVPISGGGTATVDSSFRTFASAAGAALVVTTAARLPATAAKWTEAIALDTGVHYLYNGTAWFPHRPQFGAASGNFSGAQEVTVAVAYPIAYPAGVVPTVVATPQIDAWATAILDPTNTGFTVKVRNYAGVSNFGFFINWVAHV